MSLLLSFAFDVRECIPNLLAFLGVPERESKLGQENLRFLGPPVGNPSLSLSFFSASVTFLQTCPRTVTFLLTSTIWSSFCLTIINNFLTYHVLPAEMTFTRVSIVFYVNGVIFLPHMSNEFLICDYSWTKSWSVLEAVVKLRRQRGKCVLLACLNILQLHSYLI